MKKVYSEKQVFWGSFLGGPLAAIYLLKKDFEAVNKYEQAKKTLTVGLILTGLLMLALPFLPEKFPSPVIPIGYSIYAKTVALKNGFKKKNMQTSGLYTFHSNWNVLLVSVASIIIFLMIAIPVIIAFHHAGLLALKTQETPS